MSTYRKDPKTGQTLITPGNKVDPLNKNGKTYNELGTKPPKQPPAAEGDPEEAKKFMRALGMHGLADMYETNGDAAVKNPGQLPPMFQNHPFAGVIEQPNVTSSPTVKILNPEEMYPQAQNYVSRSGGGTATVGDVARVKTPPKKVVSQIALEPGSLPLPNELESFASYNNIFSFGCLSPEELNFPDDTYRKTGLRNGHMVLKSGGAFDGTQKPRTHAEKHYNIDTQYFIDNVDIETVIAPNKKSRMTNFHNLSFEVREPYSMGQLLQTMQLASTNAGYSNYLEAPWLLTINFVGWQDIGEGEVNPQLSAAKRLLPLKIVSVDFNVDTEGSIYRFSCSAFNDEAFMDGTQNLPCNVTIHGTDLQEICQSGLGSLATQINTHLLQKQKFQKNKIETDEFVFTFPLDTSSASASNLLKNATNSGTAYGTNKATEGDEYLVKEGIDYEAAFTTIDSRKDSAGYVEDNNDWAAGKTQQKKDYVNSLLGYSIKRGNLSETIKKTLANRDAGINAIGRNKITTEIPTAYGDTPFGKSGFALNPKTMTYSKNGTQINPKQRTIQFRAGTPIQRVLEELVLLSAFGETIMRKELQAKDGTIPWFRVEADVYIVEDQEAEKAQGRMPRIYVYRIVPYRANTSIFKLPNDPPAGYNKLVEDAAKAYNYMYTGLNKDILEFNIEFNNAFYKSIATDYNNKSGNNDASNQSTTEKGTQLELDNDTTNRTGANVTNIQNDTSQSKSNELAGAMTETAERRMARQFNEALVNSDVDLITMTIKILGDPYYIADSGMGNYNSSVTEWTNVTSDGSINHQNGQVDVLLNFLTPIDIDDQIGNYKMDGPAVGVSNFSGLYTVIGVNNNFSGNLFTQELELVKRPNFDLKDLEEAAAKKILDEEKAYIKRQNEARKFGEDSPQYNFAVADKDGDGVINVSEQLQANLTAEEAAKLANNKDKPKPSQPKVAKNAQVESDANYQREAFGTTSNPNAGIDGGYGPDNTANSNSADLPGDDGDYGVQ